MKTQYRMIVFAVLIVIGVIAAVAYYSMLPPSPTPTPTSTPTPTPTLTPTPTPPLPTPIPGIQLYVHNIAVWTNGTVSFKVTLYEYESGILEAVLVNDTRFSWSDGNSENATIFKDQAKTWRLDVGNFNEGEVVHIVVVATPEYGSNHAIARSPALTHFKAVVNGMRDVDILVRVDISEGLTKEEAERISEVTFIEVMGERVTRRLDTLTFNDTQIKAHYTWGVDESDMGHVFDMTVDLTTLLITVTHCR